MTRLELLNNHLNSLTAVNDEGAYNDDIKNVVCEINKELGIGAEEQSLSSYSTKELHEELVKRTGIYEINIDNGQEAVFLKIVGDEEESTSIKGPARVLFNQD